MWWTPALLPSDCCRPQVKVLWPRQTAWWNCRFSTDASKGSRLDLVGTRQHLVKGRSHGPNQPRADAHSSLLHFGTLALEIIPARDLWALASPSACHSVRPHIL